MPAKITYIKKDGNTVPYPALFDEIRQNHGYVETRGKPENVDLIPETQRSDALRALLYDVASDRSAIASLGCDLGEKRFRKRRLSLRWQAGGYIQFLPNEDDEQGHAVLRPLTKTIDRIVAERAEEDSWEVDLALVPVRLLFDEEQYAQSVEVWFHAMASTKENAIASRERLIQAVTGAVVVFHRNRRHSS